MSRKKGFLSIATQPDHDSTVNRPLRSPSLSFSADSIVHPHLERTLGLAGFVRDGDLDRDLVLPGAVLGRDGVLAGVGATRLAQRELGVVVLRVYRQLLRRSAVEE